MQEQFKIIKAIITPQSKSPFAPMPSVSATLSNGQKKTLFSIKPNEKCFPVDELIGLTEIEANHLISMKRVDQ
jgi:hypothetical protein